MDYDQGRIGLPPPWVRVMYAAKWMGVAPWDLIEQDDIWTDWARCLMEIERTGRERQQAKGGKS